MIVEISNAFGIGQGLALFLFVLVIIWSAVWKLMAMWKSSRKGSLVWFIALGVINTLGILEILYIYLFSEMKSVKRARPTRSRRRKR